MFQEMPKSLDFEIVPLVQHLCSECIGKKQIRLSRIIYTMRVNEDNTEILASILRYPNEFIFRRDDVLYRQVEKPVLIDTLSFEKYKSGDLWIDYRQFCQHFLAPLSLMVYCDIRRNQLLRIYIDGVPRIDNHSGIMHRLKWQSDGIEWVDYYNEINYTQLGLEMAKPRSVWDLWANTGLFSRLASKHGIFTVAFDVDPACVERTYLETVKHQESCLFPLLLDLTNPRSGIGWENKGRTYLINRGPVDMVFALALLHHLTIVPKDDSQVREILDNRKDIFDGYTQEIFEQEFSQYFMISQKDPIIDPLRTLYLMKRC